jgi:hypothetical protein
VSDTAAPETTAADDSMADATAAEHATDGCEQAAGEPAGAAQPAGEAALGEAAEERSGVPGSAVRKRKSVRFHVEEQAGPERVTGTPEGCARDATITIRLRRGDVEQVGCWLVLVGAGRAKELLASCPLHGVAPEACLGGAVSVTAPFRKPNTGLGSTCSCCSTFPPRRYKRLVTLP